MLSSSGLILIMLFAQAPQATPVATPSTPSEAPAPEAKPTPDGAVLSIETTMGTIQIGLYATKAPRSSRSTLAYAKSGFYNGTIFHRVIPGFMIQGGGLDPKMVEKQPGAPVRNEARNGLSNTRGSVALARTNDPHSATSQFFINLKDNAALDFGIARDGWGYTVFGEVLSGMEVVDAIAAVPTTRSGVHENVPIKPVVITRVRVVSEPPPVAAAPPVVKTGAPSGDAPKAPAKKPQATPTPR
jgi:cyclophilin family peptidyl-prolyl cis-trans isomerase